jgi:5-methylcytosine-specific restriction endonuclease McrA
MKSVRTARSKKANALMKIEGLSANEIAEGLRKKNSGFLQTHEWKTLRAKVVAHYGGKCMRCGAVPKRGVNVDHIKPRKTHPELALEFENLQVLCGACNKKKGNKHSTDYRTAAA